MILWKIYFWIYITIVAFGSGNILLGLSSTQVTNRVLFDIAISVLGALALFSYVFKKPIFRKRAYLLLILLMEAVSVYGTYISNFSILTVGGLLSFLLEVPTLYAIVRLTTGKVKN